MKDPERPPAWFKLVRIGLMIHLTLIIGLPTAFVLVGLITDRDAPSWRGLVTLLFYAAPAVFAIRSKQQPAALLLAGVGTLLPVLPLFIFGLPLVLPASLYLIAYGRASGAMEAPRVAVGWSVALLVVLVVVSWAGLFHTEKVCYQIVEKDGRRSKVSVPESQTSFGWHDNSEGGHVVGSGCGSETTPLGLGLSGVAMFAALGGGLYLTRPTRVR